MPIYVYRCGSCNEYSEALQKASDPPLLECPACGAESLTRVIAPVGVIFKGSGFHKNDYSAKGGSSKSSSSEATKESTPSASESTTSSESKPEASSSADSKPGGSGDKVA